MPSSVAQIREFLIRFEDDGDPSNRRTVLAPFELSTLVETNPGIPTDYLDYMETIGFGSVRESTLMVYSGLVPAQEILPGFKSEHEILCFGDDFRGDLVGFIPSQDWKLVEIFHENYDVYNDDQSFLEFICERIYMGSDGQDYSIRPNN